MGSSHCYEDITLFLSSFYGYLDTHQDDALIAMFADDGVWYRKEGPAQGKVAIREVLLARGRSRKTCHLITNIQISIGVTDTVDVSYYLTVYDNSNGLQAVAILKMADTLTTDAQGLKLLAKRSTIAIK
ncbi:nuclear transport factor 2 family protein [Paenalcaligenes sp. Me52]|uniref:nuclear transport factor 2 family protein n=1 Tax=Paenalcaligenes sp. Me52 TaxID=3392038 RepID=UPI003D29D83F